MGEATSQVSKVKDQIERRREDISQDIDQLKSTAQQVKMDARERLNVREYIDQHPREALGLAIASGVALASLVYHPDGRSYQKKPPQRKELNETLDLTKTALMQLGKKQLNTLKSDLKGKGQSQQA